MSMRALTGVAMIVAGVSLALWTLVHPWGTFAGADIGQTQQWMVSHTFHFLAAAFGLIGLLGFAQRQFTVAGSLERAGFTLAFIGTIFFAGTGMFTAFLWPVIARGAPHLAELSGPFFTPPHPMIVITSLSYSIGHIVFGVALARAGVIEKWGAAALVLGGAMMLVPPAPLSPLPWIVFPLGGVVFGFGLASLRLAARERVMAAAA
jgi:hypothetical protein